MKKIRHAVALVLAASVLAVGPASALAAEPRLTVARTALAAALTCYGTVDASASQPIIFAPGTGSNASGVYLLGKGAFDALGRPLCAVAFPDRTTADMQDSVQYLVHAIREVARRAEQPVAVAGVSQGGLLARMALTYWPSLRRHVTDVVTGAATHHGYARGPVNPVCAKVGCPPAIWQQAGASKLLRALNDGRDETPGRGTSWTTVRSATDELVKPQRGPRPTSSLKGAVNVLIQAVCPGRATSHLGTVVDSVTLAVLADAVGHRGPARVSRLPQDVCAHPYGTGLDEQQTAAFLLFAGGLQGQGLATVPRVRREPRLRPWMRQGP